MKPGSRLADGGEKYPVLAENWDAVRLCCAVATQWRRDAAGDPAGLDYAGCASAAAGMGIDWRDAFDKLRIMESEILDESRRRSAAA